MQESQNFRTGPSSEYLAAHGVEGSPSQLEKLRTRGPDDPRDRGPDFFRDERGICWYPKYALDAYIAKRLAARQFRAAAPQPLHFRRRGSDQAA